MLRLTTDPALPSDVKALIALAGCEVIFRHPRYVNGAKVVRAGYVVVSKSGLVQAKVPPEGTFDEWRACIAALLDDDKVAVQRLNNMVRADSQEDETWPV